MKPAWLCWFNSVTLALRYGDTRFFSMSYFSQIFIIFKKAKLFKAYMKITGGGCGRDPGSQTQSHVLCTEHILSMGFIEAASH